MVFERYFGLRGVRDFSFFQTVKLQVVKAYEVTCDFSSLWNMVKQSPSLLYTYVNDSATYKMKKKALFLKWTSKITDFTVEDA
jgi:hypothetical protein